MKASGEHPKVHLHVCSVSRTGLLSLPNNGESLSFNFFSSARLGNDRITLLSSNAPSDLIHAEDRAVLTTAF